MTGNPPGDPDDRGASAGLDALAAKSEAAGLHVKRVVEKAPRTDIPDVSRCWAVVRADRFSHVLDKLVANPARHNFGMHEGFYGPVSAKAWGAHLVPNVARR